MHVFLSHVKSTVREVWVIYAVRHLSRFNAEQSTVIV